MSQKPIQVIVEGDGAFTRLYEDGHASQPFLKDSGNKIAETLRRDFPDILGEATFVQGPVKGWDRSAAKLASDTQPGLDLSKAADITDIARGRIVIDTPEQIRAIRETLADPEKRAALGIVEAKDRFAVPSGTHYRDINMTVRLENGHLAEIQINQRDLLAASEFTHDAYEEMSGIEKRAALEGRPLTVSEEESYRRLANYTRDVHDYGAVKVPGLDDLLSDKGRNRLNADYADRLKSDPAFRPGVTIEADTRYGVPFVHRAEAYGGEGYKALARQYGVEPERLAVDTSALERPTVRWDAPTQSVIATDPQRLSDMLERRNITPQRYAELGASLKIEAPNGLKNAAESLADFGKKAGPVAGVVVGGLAGTFTLAAGGSKAEAAQVVYETAVPYGETQLDLARGDLEAAKRSATIETASNIGFLGGAAAGAKLGAGVGTLFFPGAGTAAGTGVGAVAGGLIGGFGGGFGAAYLMEKIHDNYATLKSGTIRLAHETAASFTDSVQETKRLLGSWFKKDPALDVQTAFASLPDSVTPDMPPEVAALVEVKAVPELFRKSFAEIEQHGGLSEVAAYLANHPPEAEQPTPVAENHPVHYVRLSAPGVR